MLFTELIRKKRDANTLTEAEIQFFVEGLLDQEVPAEQISAFAMAVFLNSMDSTETALLTQAMANSGDTLNWAQEDLPGPAVDKHSTGGVGDKVSFLLAPIAAACGCCVPMISGRGLGHSGGTLDKIGAIPGYEMFPALDKFRQVVKQVGCAIIGQTSNLAPADKRFYAIRDITSTVESIPLITASILCKKIAAGNEALIMDVKWGNGAFMQDLASARALARSIIDTATKAQLKTRVLITDMNEVLGLTAGNALEIRESLDFLGNQCREPRLNDVVVALVVEMLLATKLYASQAQARERVESAITSGAAMEKFAQMVSALGGPTDFVENASKYLPAAEVIVPIIPNESGFLAGVDTRAIGNAIIELGGGRTSVEQVLDLSVGFGEIVPLGTRIETGQALAVVHAKNRDDAEKAKRLVLQACTILPDAPELKATVAERLTQ